MKHRRGELDIIASVLAVAQKDVLKTNILDGCRLGGEQCNAYVNFLFRLGLIDAYPVLNTEVVSGRRSNHRMRYHISKGGQRFLELYADLVSLVNPRY